MSERFSNKVLKQAYEAFDDAYNEVYWGTPTPTVEVVAAAQAAGFAAMRAVLEGQEDARIVALRRCLMFTCACGDEFDSVERFAEHVDAVHADEAGAASDGSPR